MSLYGSLERNTCLHLRQIRAFNRLGKLAHAKLLVFIQDGDLPPVKPVWTYHMAVSVLVTFILAWAPLPWNPPCSPDI